MNPATARPSIDGPAGTIVCAVDEPSGGDAPRGVAVLCHPHPLHGGTLDNKVVQTMARAFVQQGWRAVRFNFRGVGGSAGAWDEGRGEVDDALAVAQAFQVDGLPLAAGGFSFGGYVASQLAARRVASSPVERLVLVAPAVRNFPMAPVPADTLVIHGETDDVVPLADVLAWAREAATTVLPVTVVPGTGHFFHGQLSLLKQLITAALPR
jgi:alpha/beta superfamily hydrolase